MKKSAEIPKQYAENAQAKTPQAKTLAPTAKGRESEFPPTEGLNASENIML